MGIIASFVWRMYRNDATNGRQHCMFIGRCLRCHAHYVQIETLRQFSGGRLIELVAIFDMIIFQNEFPYVHLLIVSFIRCIVATLL